MVARTDSFVFCCIPASNHQCLAPSWYLINICWKNEYQTCGGCQAPVRSKRDHTPRLIFMFLSSLLLLTPSTHSSVSEGLSDDWETWRLQLPTPCLPSVPVPHPAMHLTPPHILLCCCRHIMMWVGLCMNMFFKCLKYEIFHCNRIHIFFTEFQISVFENVVL